MIFYFGLFDRDLPGVDDQIGNHWFSTGVSLNVANALNNNSSAYQATSAGGQSITEVGLVNNFRLWLDVLVEPIQADFNGDADVDGADFLVWQRNLGIAGGAALAQGDANRDRAVDGRDLEFWRAQFGGTPSAIAAPEPAVLATLLPAMALAMVLRNRRGGVSYWQRCPCCRR